MTEQIGLRTPRKEDRRLLVGEGRFGADVRPARTAHVRVVRSPIAHGRLRDVDTAEARDLSGVIDVVTADDLPSDLRIPVRLDVGTTDLTEHLQPVLARESVRYVGEPI